MLDLLTPFSGNLEAGFSPYFKEWCIVVFPRLFNIPALEFIGNGNAIISFAAERVCLSARLDDHRSNDDSKVRRDCTPSVELIPAYPPEVTDFVLLDFTSVYLAKLLDPFKKLAPGRIQHGEAAQHLHDLEATVVPS